MEYYILADRSVISVSGPDRHDFFQGIISNDIHKCHGDGYLYALLLTPQGKIISDFFILENGESFLLDCPTGMLETILKKFRIYKLRSNVEIADLSEQYTVLASNRKLNARSYPDPRHEKIGFRAIMPKSQEVRDATKAEITKYHSLRISLLLPDFTMDLIPEKFFPAELGMDDLHAIDYEKGCYVGQEVTARTHYRGQVRKKLYHIGYTGNKPEYRTEVIAGGRKIGVILGCCLNNGLALMRIEETRQVMDNQSELVPNLILK